MKKFNAKLAVRSYDRITVHNKGDPIEFHYNNRNRNVKIVAAKEEVICCER